MPAPMCSSSLALCLKAHEALLRIYVGAGRLLGGLAVALAGVDRRESRCRGGKEFRFA